MSGRHAGDRTAVRRRFPVVLSVATALGLWLGMDAPDISPVAPPVAAAAPAPVAAAATVTAAPAAVTSTPPTQPQAPTGDPQVRAPDRNPGGDR